MAPSAVAREALSMPFQLVDPEIGFTSDVIRDPNRFVGRRDLIERCIHALNTASGIIAVYGKRGVGKSSLMRQVQQMANGDYQLAYRAGLGHLVPNTPRRYYTVYYSSDSAVNDLSGLIIRLCNDSDPEDGLLRLIPDNGKDLIEFSRSGESESGFDLKLVHWGERGADSSKYASTIPNDPIQTFRNFANSAVDNNNKFWRKRESLLLLIDEFDVIGNKEGIGSLFKSLSSHKVKFGICGIGQDISALIKDHQSIMRLIERSALHVRPMTADEARQVFLKAEELFKGIVKFEEVVVEKVVEFSEGYPYFAQLLGKACVDRGNRHGTNRITTNIFEEVLQEIRTGEAFPHLEEQFQLAVGESEDRKLLLTLLAEQESWQTQYNQDIGRIVLKQSRATAQELGIEYIDQLVPRLIDEKFGPVLVKTAEQRGAYEFTDPVFRAYIKLRH
jgi:Cdc6-like AAA superfamily ATPase